MINDINADTEFNDALIAHGIIPPRPKTPEEPDLVLPTHRDILDHIGQTSSTSALQALADDAPDSDDERLFLDYRKKKMAEMQEMQKKEAGVQGGTTKDGLRQIGRDEFVREVSEGSKRELPGEEGEERGTGVICFLYKDYIPASNHLRALLSRLAPHHPLCRFLTIEATHCIPNYPDKNVPTLLLYRNGHLLHQMVGLPPKLGLKLTVSQLEMFLVDKAVLDSPSGGLQEAERKRKKEREADGSGSEESDGEDEEFGTIRRGKSGVSRGIRNGGVGLGVGKKGRDDDEGDDDDDSDFDL